MMKLSSQHPVLCALVMVVIAALGSTAQAQNSSTVETFQYLIAGDAYELSDGTVFYASFSLHDLGPGYLPGRSGRVLGNVYIQHPDYSRDNLYICLIDYPEEAAFNALPDKNAWLAAKSDFSFTYVAPACDGYPQTTFTVFCDASEIVHIAASSGEKQTFSDNTRIFFGAEYEQIESLLDEGVDDYTCSLSVTNTLGSQFFETAKVDAKDYKRKVK